MDDDWEEVTAHRVKKTQRRTDDDDSFSEGESPAQEEAKTVEVKEVREEPK